MRLGGVATGADRALVTIDAPAHWSALDSLRGLAAVSVVLFHMTWTSPLYPLPFVRNGYLMVDLFFVLSGFVIASAYGGRISSPQALGRFLWLRFWRLYPVHLVFLIVFVAVEVAKYIAEYRYGIHANHPALGPGWTGDLVANLLLVQGLTNGAASFNGPSWSISVECAVYLMFAGLSLAARSRAVVAATSCALSVTGLLLFAWLGRSQVTHGNHYGILPGVAGFFLGVTVSGFAEHGRGSAFVRRHGHAVGLAALAALALFMAFMAMPHQGYETLAVFPLSAALVLLLAMAPASGPFRPLHWSGLRWLGAISYPVYMAQEAVIWPVKGLLRLAFHARDIPIAGHDPILDVPAAAGLVAAVATILLLLGVAETVHSFVEVPWRRWSRRRHGLWLLSDHPVST
ncbi:MAG: acyltransferase [Aliidongia sp.]